MKLMYIGSEALPFVSTGGLGDVLGSLPAAVRSELGDDSEVCVVVPMYQNVKQKFGDTMTLECEFTVRLSWRNQYCGVWSAKEKGITYYFIDNEYYFKRSSLYGSYDDGERFAFFGKAVLEMMAVLNFYPDILHANDWQSALTVIYLKRKYSHREEYSNIKAVYTIHNIGYQGVYDFSILSDIFELAVWDRGVIEYNGSINLTKGAIVCADIVTTVSPKYAEEIQTDYYSSGLHHILRIYRDKVTGIINGIDTDYYNPETDDVIAEKFTSDDLAGKAVDKKELQQMCGLPVRADVPVIAMVSRLASHKGFDLVKHVMSDLLRNDVQFVLLGKGEFELEDFFEGIAARYPEKVSAMLVYDKDLSKKVYAGADIFLMPSKSEPCGLAQMISSRYGTVPVVRETGGLYDTIKAYNIYDGTGNGFTFANYNAHEMMDAINKATSLYAEKENWDVLVKRVMNIDFSWGASAKKYIGIYESI